MICTKCGLPLEPDELFCGECGHQVSDRIQQPISAAKCRNCGAECTPEEIYCGSCGQRFTPLEVREPEARCPSCVRRVELDEKFCGACGRRLGELVDELVEESGSQRGGPVSVGSKETAVLEDTGESDIVQTHSRRIWLRAFIIGSLCVILIIVAGIYYQTDFFQRRTTTKPAVLVSDSFNRPNADRCALGKIDLALGGSGEHYYLPLFARGGSGLVNPVGADIIAQSLYNNGLDYGGVQLTTTDGACANPANRGEDFGQDLNIQMKLLVPSDFLQRATQAGPIFRSQAAVSGQDLIKADSNGYWIALQSTGEVKVMALNDMAAVAFSGKPDLFDNRVFHTLEMAVQGNNLEVALDGRLLMFMQTGGLTTKVLLPPPQGANDGAAGLFFGAPGHRGQAGGQRADDLLITPFRSLQNFPVQNDFKGKSSKP